jgi:hypothetical protein
MTSASIIATPAGAYASTALPPAEGAGMAKPQFFR